MRKQPRRPRDFAQLGKLIVDIATGAAPRDPVCQPDSPATAARRKGGRKGGQARAKKLPAKRRKAIAKKAAESRWGRQARRR